MVSGFCRIELDAVGKDQMVGRFAPQVRRKIRTAGAPLRLRCGRSGLARVGDVVDPAKVHFWLVHAGNWHRIPLDMDNRA
jgi:hypothetical protein